MFHHLDKVIGKLQLQSTEAQQLWVVVQQRIFDYVSTQGLESLGARSEVLVEAVHTEDLNCELLGVQLFEDEVGE